MSKLIFHLNATYLMKLKIGEFKNFRAVSSEEMSKFHTGVFP